MICSSESKWDALINNEQYLVSQTSTHGRGASIVQSIWDQDVRIKPAPSVAVGSAYC